MIGVIDYGAGNLGNVARALNYLNCRTRIIGEPDDLSGIAGLVLPGVGSFARGVEGLKQRELFRPVKNYIFSGRPFLGICLGMQLLFQESRENTGLRGLGAFPGRCEKFSPGESGKVPHMGWNNLRVENKNSLLQQEDKLYLYFVHSYYLPVNPKIVLASTVYGGQRFMSAVNRERVWGLQPHPEKSGSRGLKILRNFVEVVNGDSNSSNRS